jgi:hypothetical protein
MFEGENRALTQASGRGRFSLLTIRNQSDAFETARQGWWVAGWFALGYSIALLGAFAQRSWAVAIVCAGCVALAIVLVIFIRSRQARWACMVLAAWTVLEAAVKLPLVFKFGPLAGLGMILNVALVVIAIRALRGAFMLAAFRRGVHDPKTLDKVFE